MANTGFKGIDVRQTGTALLFDAFLQDSSGNDVISGSAALTIYEVQSDGTLKSYDFNDNTFKTTALTTATLALTHRTGNNGTVNTGLWTVALATLTGFTVGAIYEVQVSHAIASPPKQTTKFQYGSEQGDLVITAGSTGQGAIQGDLTKWLTGSPLALSSQQVQAVVPASTVVASVTGAVGSVTAGVTLAAAAVQAIWDALTSALTTAGSIGKLLVTNIDALISSRLATGSYTAPDNTSIATLISRLTTARAGYLDNLNVGGPVASHADILAFNQSSSKHILLTTVGQYERPEAGSTVYAVEARTFAALDGSAVNADSTPTLTATGTTSGSLAANISVATNPATGVYRWTYTVLNTATQEPIRFDVSATIAAATFTLSVYTQVVDEVSSTWTAADRTMLTNVYNNVDDTISDVFLQAHNAYLNALQASTSAQSVDAKLTTQRATNLDNLDVTVGSRLATTGYTAPPTAAQNVTALWTALMASGDFATVGSIGKLLKDDIDAKISSVSGGGAGLSGPSSVTLTFHDASNVAVPNVEFTIVGQGSMRANASGVAAFGLADGTYTVTAAPAGLVMFSNATLTVSGTTTLTITGSNVSIPTVPAGQVSGYLYTRDGHGSVLPTQTVWFQLKDASATGDAWSRVPFSAISNSSGLLTATLQQNATYRGKLASGGWKEFSTTTTSPFAIPEILGPQ